MRKQQKFLEKFNTRNYKNHCKRPMQLMQEVKKPQKSNLRGFLYPMFRLES